jgi:DNA-binding transcriptional ArsR family regulator
LQPPRAPRAKASGSTAKGRQQLGNTEKEAHRAMDQIPFIHYPRKMEEQEAIIALTALAQGMRLRVFRALVGAGPQGLTPGALSALLDVPASTLSFHLKELSHAGLVAPERDGRNLIYRPQLPHMAALLAYLSDHCCQGAPCGATPSAAACKTC